MNPHDPRAPTGQAAIAANQREALSVLADGEAGATQVAAACQAWRDEPVARQTWHAYQLIGDVLRSDELARPAAADAAFLARLRTRLADEPVVLAPMRTPEPVGNAEPARAPQAPHRAAPRWLLPSAVAAGFVAVAGVLVLTRINAPDAGVVEARASAPLAQPRVAAAVPSGQPAATMIRNAELDAYLQAHQSARGRGAVAVPGGMLRSAEVMLPADAPR